MKDRWFGSRLWFRLALLVFLAGCNSLPGGLGPAEHLPAPALTVDSQAVATSLAQQLAAQTITPLPEPEIPAATKTPFPPVSPTTDWAAPGACTYWPAEMVDQPLPEPGQLKWIPQQGEVGRWLSLEGYASPVMEAEPAPGGRWWAVRVLRKAQPAGPWETALYVLDTAGDQHWQASLEGDLDHQQFAWLADGSLVWVDQQRLWLASSDGVQRRDLNAPEAVYEVWRGAQDRLLVSGASGLWRVDVAAGAWLPVSELAPLAALFGPPAFSGTSSNLSVAPDGRVVVLAAASSMEQSNAQVWLMPFDAAEPPRLVAEVSYLGRGGRLPAPKLLGNGQFIDPGQEVGEAGVFDRMERVLLPANGGPRIALSSLLPEDHSLLAVQASPDGQWMALVLVPTGANPADAVWSVEWINMVALQPLYILPGDTVLGWRSLPAAAWLVEHAAGRQIIRQAGLPDGDGIILTEAPAEALPAVVPAGKLLYLLIGDRLITFDEAGTAGPSYRLPVPFLSIDSHQTSITGQVLLTGVSAVDDQGQCSFRFPVILWLPGLS